MRDRTGRFITQQLIQIIHRLADHGGVPPQSCFDAQFFKRPTASQTMKVCSGCILSATTLVEYLQ